MSLDHETAVCDFVRDILSARTGEVIERTSRPEADHRDVPAVEELWESSSFSYAVEHTVTVSATHGPSLAYWAQSAESYVYRKTGKNGWELAMAGLPSPTGTTASRFAVHPGEPGVIYGANNRGVFRSDDAGRRWAVIDVPWPEPGLADGVSALACLPE